MLDRDTPSVTRMTVMIITMLIAVLAGRAVADEKTLVFGTLPIAKPTRLFAMYKGLVDYYARELGQPVRLEIGKDYADAIAKFQSGHYHFGFLGPSPYIIATESSPLGTGNFRLAASLETKQSPTYRAALITHKDNNAITTISDLKGKRFAFGSRESTLSFYLPAKMLIDAGVFDQLQGYETVGKHDVVINTVYGGKYDAGGVKESMADGARDRIKVIAYSEPVWDFIILSHHTMDNAQFDAIRQATLALKDPAILEAVKPGATGFVPTDDRNYDNLRRIMSQVNRYATTRRPSPDR